MLPPIEEAVLENNPEFAALYRTLTTVILNPDGSTKNDPAMKERETVREELKKHRLKAAKRHLLIDAISTAYPGESPKPARRPRALSRPDTTTSELPPELLDLLLLLPPLLTTSTPLPAESTALLLTSPPLCNLPTLLPQLTALVSTALHTSAVHLARLASPNTNPSYIHRAIPTLPTHAATQLRLLADAKAALTATTTTTTTTTTSSSPLPPPPSSSRPAAAAALTRLLRAHATASAACARALEAKHGGASRALELRAAAAAAGCRRSALEAEAAAWVARRDAYPPEAMAALGAYARHLRDGRGRLREGVAGLRGQLGGYGVGEGGDGGKERTMREMARVYRDMERQVEEVRADLERLGRA
ncbi:hypothetical protein QBC33DRAFT_584171 [Phialemonium atrogriseum]|uniref:Uncharacterized protein n=1 Tax=Phialemonium atrogriseum TaxID=1093897 RepID=A0AAJ0FRV9_9PEZI|nr:uncharacterized protein QBC33DRAFT_584171 [Phialemonium atrogriseum]KAK1772829.1 hypothetical protein QBC33DRAFT_584171 [Phialemonium atrogriseum]